MLRIILLLCLVVTAAADEIRFGDEHFVAPPRIGYGTDLSEWNAEVTVTEGDGQFLITWLDERASNPALTPLGNRSGALAIRVDASGRVLDPHPFPLPVYSATTVWTGTDWIIVGDRAARINREGQVTAISDVRFPSLYAAPIGDAAWTGEALVVARVLLGVDGPGLVVRTVDARLQLIEERMFLTEAHGGTGPGAVLIGVASDGISAVVAYRREHYGDEQTRLAVFGRDGHMISEGTLPPGPTYETIAAGPNGYMVIGANPATGRFEGTIINVNGDVHPTEPFVLTSDLTIQFGDHLSWDGTGFTLLRYGSPSSAVRLMTMRFDAQGKVLERPADLSGSIPDLPVLAFMGNTVAMAGFIRVRDHSSAPKLDIRVAPRVQALFAQPSIRIPLAAVPRETPAAAANGTNLLVAWRERVNTRGALNVAATLLHRNGTPVDGGVITLGFDSCHGAAPAVTTNGRDFLVAWASEHAVLGVIVRGDGTAGPPFRIGRFGACSDAQVSVASNGSHYLAVWGSPDMTGRLEVHGVRITSDAATHAAPQFHIGYAAEQAAASTTTSVVSDGTDFLVAWDNMAARVTAAGDVLDASPLSLGSGKVHGAWYNGRTYVVAVYEPNYYLFYRIRSDGSGGDGWPNPAPARHYVAHQTPPFLPVCEGNRCLAFGYSELLHIEDRGYEFRMLSGRSNLDFWTMVRPVLVKGDRVMAVYARSITEMPYSYAPAILLRTAQPEIQRPGRQRSVRH